MLCVDACGYGPTLNGHDHNAQLEIVSLIDYEKKKQLTIKLGKIDKKADGKQNLKLTCSLFFISYPDRQQWCNIHNTQRKETEFSVGSGCCISLCWG